MKMFAGFCTVTCAWCIGGKAGEGFQVVDGNAWSLPEVELQVEQDGKRAFAMLAVSLTPSHRTRLDGALDRLRGSTKTMVWR